MNAWEEVRHQVAIDGRITDARTNQPLGGVRVEIAAAPIVFTAWLALRSLQYGKGWAALDERPDRAWTAADGHFYFLDLPDGDYTLAASLPDAGSRYGQVQATARVSRNAQGDLFRDTANMALPPTILKGQVSDQNNSAVLLAQVQIQGSGERTFSDKNGQYVLGGLEVGTRLVQVSAQVYESVVQTVQLQPAGSEQTLDVTLVPAALTQRQ